MTITRMQEPRQLYGLGSLVKSVTKGVKKLVKSPVGKAALLIGGAGLAGLGPAAGLRTSGLGNFLFGGATKFLPANAIKGAAVTDPGLFGKAASMFGNLKTGTKLGLLTGLTSYLASGGMEEDEIEEVKRDPDKLRVYLKDYFTKLNPKASSSEVEDFVETNVSEYATGGRVGFSEGGDYDSEFMKLVGEFMERGFSQQEAIEEARDTLQKKSMATGGRVGFSEGKNMMMASGPDLQDSRNDMANQMFGKDLRLLTEEELEALEDEIDRLSVKFMAKGGMPTGIMRTNEAGTIERDYRETGGFVPVGIKEKADDVPAMLSKNEFVMTADAVRGMGNGSIEKGAQRLYDQMKSLEKRVV